MKNIPDSIKEDCVAGLAWVVGRPGRRHFTLSTLVSNKGTSSSCDHGRLWKNAPYPGHHTHVARIFDDRYDGWIVC
jgi:hypothetical protein